jgi:triphosphoribosyl-dephospho-CoA synthase
MLIKLSAFNKNKEPQHLMYEDEESDHIAKCFELAILLEASAHKPGNVSLVTNFENTRYEHFLASAVASRPFFARAARQGLTISNRTLSPSQAGIGRIIRECISEVNSWQHGGNTLLGTIILLCPIAVSAGMNSQVNRSINISELRKSLKLIVEATTPEDAVNVYEAIVVANPGGLGKVGKFDVNDPHARQTILNEGISLYEVFKLASGYDNICSEWVNNHHITFEHAYPQLENNLNERRDSETAIIRTFLAVLSEYPDSFIARKVGFDRARAVSSMAKEVLNLGGLETLRGRKSLNAFDQKLRESGNLLNPGTTADIISAALALSVLNGYRP